MKKLRTAGIVMFAYLALVVLFEVFLGVAQPRFEADRDDGWDATIVITTTGEDGSTQDRVVSPMLSDGVLYVSANHWPRSWYNRVLENPDVQVTNNGETRDYRAVLIPPSGEDHDRLEKEHAHPFFFRFLTGFPPRRFVRLEPR